MEDGVIEKRCCLTRKEGDKRERTEDRAKGGKSEYIED